MSKIALITGATSGIGKATATLFAENSWNLILAGRRLDRLEAFSAELESDHGIQTHVLHLDVREQEAVATSISGLSNSWKKIDLLVNNAGLAAGADPIDQGLLDDWERMIDTNVKGLLYVSKAVIPLLKKQGQGQIVNLGSIAGKETYPKGNVYCATKHAVEAITKGMRIDLLSYNIKVTNVCPGAVDTEFSNVRFHGDQAKADAVYKGFDPLLAQDVAEVIWFVANRPVHVNINDILVMPTQQASSVHFYKE